MISTKWLYLFVAVLLFSSCKKEEQDDILKTKIYKDGYLVLCEGLFNQNNSSLDWVDTKNDEVKKNIFEAINGRPLGDIANHMIEHGGKIYIAVSTSSTVEILDKNTLKSIKQIQFNYNNKIQQPRELIAKDNHVYVTSFDGYVSAIDTNSLKVTKRVKVGRNPEGITISGNAIYVANSGGLDANNLDSTVMKIDITNFSVVDTFVVGKNPGDMIADDYGNVYVVKRGDYVQNPSELVQININSNAVTNLHHPATSISKKEDMLYLSFYNFNNGSSTVSRYNTETQAVDQENYLSTSEVTTLYGVIPLENDKVICIDAMNYVNSGYLRFFNENKQLKKSIQVSLNPNTIIFK